MNKRREYLERASVSRAGDGSRLSIAEAEVELFSIYCRFNEKEHGRRRTS